MKRFLIFAGLAAVVVLVLASRHPRRLVATGSWHGQTTQGRPIDFVVDGTADDAEITAWRVMFDLECQKTGRIIHAGIASSFPARIVGNRFQLDVQFVGFWDHWEGAFLPGEEARGQMATVWASLIGEDMKKLATEKCQVFDLGWTARPGDPRAAVNPPPDVKITITRDAHGKPVAHAEWTH